MSRRVPTRLIVAAALVAAIAACAGHASAQVIDTAAATRVLSVYDQAPAVLPTPDTLAVDDAWRAGAIARVVRPFVVRRAPEAQPSQALSRPSSARPATTLQTILYWTTEVTQGLAAGADLHTTVRNIDTGLFHEGNRLIATSDGRLNKPLKVGASVGVPVVNHFVLWRPGHRWKAIGVNTAMTFVWGLAAASNEIQYRAVVANRPPPSRAFAKFTVRF